MFPRFVGPFKVIKQINPVAFKLELPDVMKIHNVFHVNLLRKYISRPISGVEGRPLEPPPPPIIIDEEKEFEVELILADRDREVSSRLNQHGRTVKRMQREYLVKWVGYDHVHNQYVPEEDLDKCQEAIQAYLRTKGQVEANS